jgi:hypothetical protein
MEDRTELADQSIGGTGLVAHGRPARTFRRGRVCAEAGCDTKLSIYNDDDRCSLHVNPSAPRLRGKKIA